MKLRISRREPPCGNCPKKGCGTYHDICEEYRNYRALCDEDLAKRDKIFDETYYFYKRKVKTHKAWVKKGEPK